MSFELSRSKQDDRHDQLRVGVIGVGSMGENHARVYRQLAGTDLVGVVDQDQRRSRSVAAKNAAKAMPTSELLDSVDAVSVAVPTKHHYEVVDRVIDAGVHVLVEKPFVDRLADGRTLAKKADRAGVILQVGHIERFNPAVSTALDLANQLDVIAMTTRRLGPPVERAIEDDVVLDLMLHDIDVMIALASAEPTDVDALGCRNGQYALAQIAFADGTVGSLTASRVTQRRVRSLEITADECQVDVDYLDQSVYIHRHAEPEYTRNGDGIRYRNESVIERPMVESEEPLKRQLASFATAVKEDRPPAVSAEDGLEVLEIVNRIRDDIKHGKRQEVQS